MIHELLEKQKQYIDYFFNNLDLKACEALCEIILQTPGHIYLTGVGKSGFISQKIASTLMSIGIRALFLSPTDALHGDLGVIAKGDLVLLFSKTGESQELLELMPFLKIKGAKRLAITSNAQSRLAQLSDSSLHLPCLAELCPFDLAPTISAEIQLLFGDLIAVSLMHRKQFTLDQYAVNHPKGQIGKRANIRVKDLMLDLSQTPCCHPEDCLQDVLVEFTSKHCGCLLVVDQNKQLQGIFTDGDLRRALQLKGKNILEQKLAQLMTACPKTILEDDLAWEAVRKMESDKKQPVMVLPVIHKEKGEVIGILKMHDLIQAGL